MKKHYREEKDCLNCGATLIGPFCHICGQENLQIKESFGHMMNHAISDYFHFDHKFFHTLKPLFFKPGTLTNEYMEGRRTQYLHPVKMYIFISLVYFLILFQQKQSVIQVEDLPTTIEQVTQAAKKINQSQFIPVKEKKEAINDLYKEAGFKKVDNQWVKDTSRAARKRVEDNKRWVTPTGNDTTYAQYTANQLKLPEAKRDGWFKQYWNKKAYAIDKQNIDMKETITEGFKHNFSKVMFVLLPLFALFLMITFRKNKKYYVEHLIYSFHLHCFIFLFLTIVLLIGMCIPDSWIVLDGWITFIAGCTILFYVYKSLRVVYHRSWWRTIFKMIGIYMAYFISFLVCIAALTMITIFTAA